ncbi:hypothetical protein BaRGS_00016901 [Batillaria attramentaria]|uniref:Uncharacterized protein n=1 Tax=Batillaria attramentaria TaxID=370345 RepID=A0ABD0KXE0_9CAEN
MSNGKETPDTMSSSQQQSRRSSRSRQRSPADSKPKQNASSLSPVKKQPRQKSPVKPGQAKPEASAASQQRQQSAAKPAPPSRPPAPTQPASVKQNQKPTPREHLPQSKIGAVPYRQELAKLTDRTISTEDRKRLARAAAQKLFASKNSCQLRPQPVLTHTNSMSLKTSRAPAPPRRTASMGKEVSKDFLTLACYNAVATGQLGLLKALQKTGKAPQVDKQGNTPLHVAAKCGQLKCLK